ncbi:MAG: ABC transporter permease [Deltaproteobacteria bacterium]|nr:ABC transporter permease [Deltaproteobacteria bacterium]
MWFLAVRYLCSRKRQSVLILIGILLGSGAFVTISGMMLGFQEFLIEQLVNNDAHIRISAREELITPDALQPLLFPERARVAWIVPPSGRRDYARIDHPQGWYDRLEAEPNVAAFSPQFVAQVLVRRGVATQTGRLIGCDPERQTQVTNFADYMIDGTFEAIGRSGNRIIVGEMLLQRLGGRLGETLLVSVGKGVPAPFKVVGVYRTGMQQIDEVALFGSLSDVQQLHQTPSYVSDIAVKLHDYTTARALAAQWQAASIDRVQSWDVINSGTLSIFRTQNFVRSLMTGSLLLVAGFGIYNVLNMMIAQKRGEIAILRSMGYEAGDVRRLFLYQGLVLGIIGGLVGLVIGYLACCYIATIEVDPGRFNRGGRMLVSFDIWIYVRGIVQAVVVAIFSSLFPARSAGRLSPVEILRAEVG